MTSTISVGALVDAGEASLQTGPFGTQFKAAEYSTNGTPMINVKNIGFGAINSRDLDCVGPQTRERLGAHVVQAGDIVFARKGAVDRHAFIRNDQEGWMQGSDCIRLRVSSPRFLNRYVSYVLLTPHHRQWMINQCSHGATMASLNQDILRRIELPTVAIAEQERVVAVLQGYDDLTEINLRRIEILEEMARAIFREWFVNLNFPRHQDVELVDSGIGPIPEGWQLSLFGHVAKEVREGTDPQRLGPDIPYVGLEHIPRRSIVLTDWGRSSDVASRKWRFRQGDILFGKLRPYFHKVARAPCEGICSTDAIVIRANDSLAEYALFVASSDEFVAHATATAGGTDRPRASWRDLASYPTILPPDGIVEKFGDHVRPQIALMFNLADENRNLKTTRDLLLPKLISGEIDVSKLEIDVSWLAA